MNEELVLSEVEGRRLRVGIDVGGTFTDVVAIDAATRELVAAVKVPTSHAAPEGVAAGIVAAIERLLRESGIDSGSVAFIAHSTTQATNALLEGDLAPVGVLGLVDGLAWLSRRQMRFGALPLGSDARFAPAFAFAPAGDERAMREGIDRLILCGANAIAATQSFGVDRPHCESRAVAIARERGVDATSGHDVSSAYGLRARTRTAALNAAILPKMIRTARMTADAVDRAAIPAPLMVMRSDGGVMDVGEIERRPILTLLSGPAAGIAGALLYERLSEGVFVEVGGTSSDCSAIRAGRPQMRPARIGGHRTMLRTLDVRTIGIGGGSMLRIGGAGVRDVGPRSAHIAGCAYASFVAPQALEGARIELIAPLVQDRADYAVLLTRDGARVALTTTCAANLLGTIPAGAFARGNVESAECAFGLLADHIGGSGEELARVALALAVEKLRPAIDGLIADYEFEPDRIAIVGGRRRRGRARAGARGGDESPPSDRARRRSDRARGRRAGTRARRRRAHDLRADAPRDRRDPARGGGPRDRRRRVAGFRRGRGRDRYAAQPRDRCGIGRHRARGFDGRRRVQRGRAPARRCPVARV